MSVPSRPDQDNWGQFISARAKAWIDYRKDLQQAGIDPKTIQSVGQVISALNKARALGDGIAELKSYHGLKS